MLDRSVVVESAAEGTDARLSRRRPGVQPVYEGPTMSGPQEQEAPVQGQIIGS
jgi:hypothetical protein